MYNHHWKTYLRRNCLETKKTNFLADVAYARPTLKQADLARLIGEEGCEIREETILDIIGRYESMIRRMLLEGHCVLTPNCRMMPRVLGLWETPDSPFDPEKHRRSLDLFPTADMRKELEYVGIDVLGMREDFRTGIARVTDSATGEVNRRITPGDDVVLEGERLKVTVDDTDAGVFFIAGDGTEYRVTRRLSLNYPNRVVVRVPAGIPPGKYKVTIRTRFTPGGKCMQKELQETSSTFPLLVAEEEQT